MAIKIEVLSETTLETVVAFYYPIAPGQQLPGAVNPDKVPAGAALSVEEIDDLKLGALYEKVITYQTTGLDVAARRSKFVSEWAMGQGSAKAEYKVEFESTGDYYDGTWNEPTPIVEEPPVDPTPPADGGTP